MLYRPHPRPDADSRRATAIAAALAARGATAVLHELVEAERAVLERDEFSESALRIGALLGFDAIAAGSDVRWATPEDVDLSGENWVIAGPSEAGTNELAGAAGRLRELLGELGWRTILPRAFVWLAIERGFARHDPVAARLLERLNTDAAA